MTKDVKEQDLQTQITQSTSVSLKVVLGILAAIVPMVYGYANIMNSISNLQKEVANIRKELMTDRWTSEDHYEFLKDLCQLNPELVCPDHK